MSQKKTFFIMEGAMIAAVYVALTKQDTEYYDREENSCLLGKFLEYW